MAAALFELGGLQKKCMRDWEELAYRQGLAPGKDFSFSGVRTMVHQVEDAQRLLHRLASAGEPELYAWLAEREGASAAAAPLT